MNHLADKTDYSDWSKEDFIKEIKKLKKRKKYGIVWDEEKTKEKFDKESEGKLPVLKEIKNKEIITKDEFTKNILIEGDNYHTLSVLNYTHKNSGTSNANYFTIYDDASSVDVYTASVLGNDTAGFSNHIFSLDGSVIKLYMKTTAGTCTLIFSSDAVEGNMQSLEIS